MRAVGSIDKVRREGSRQWWQSKARQKQVAARAVVQGSGCGSSSSSGSQLVGAHDDSLFGFAIRSLGRVLQDSSSDDEAARPKPAKVPRVRTVGIVRESDSE